METRRDERDRYHRYLQARPRYVHDVRVQLDQLASRLRELAYLNSGLTIELSDERSDGHMPCSATRAASRALSAISQNDTPCMKACWPFEERDDIYVDIALQWNQTYQQQIFCFTNNIRNRDGGAPYGSPLSPDLDG